MSYRISVVIILRVLDGIGQYRKESLAKLFLLTQTASNTDIVILSIAIDKVYDYKTHLCMIIKLIHNIKGFIIYSLICMNLVSKETVNRKL